MSGNGFWSGFCFGYQNSDSTSWQKRENRQNWKNAIHGGRVDGGTSLAAHRGRSGTGARKRSRFFENVTDFMTEQAGPELLQPELPANRIDLPDFQAV